MIIDRLPLLTNPTTGDEIPVERGQNCYKIDYSDLKGEQGPAGPEGPAGADYVLTAQDKADIADIVLSELPMARGGAF